MEKPGRLDGGNRFGRGVSVFDVARDEAPGWERDVTTGVDDDVKALLPRRRVPWGGVAIAAVLVGAVVLAVSLYARFEQRGLSLRGPGHLVVLTSGDTWAFFLSDGSLVRVTAQSARALGASTGRCARLAGSLQGHDLALDVAECEGGGLQDIVVERMRRMGLRFGYWADNLESGGERLDGVLHTVEIYASLIEPRADAPQLVPLYRPLFPEVLPAARRDGLPAPVFISVRPDDLAIVRVTRSELVALLALPEFVFAGAAAKGGWIVRTVRRAADGEGALSRLLVAPTEPPWPTRLAATTLRVAPIEPASGGSTDSGRPSR